jgi:N-alpha-acetyltransferase 35, NatC auxiliary subunit
MVNLFRHHPFKDREHFSELLGLARDYLNNVRSNLPPELAPHSPATLAFDPRITRRLNSFMPLRSHCLPPQDRAWAALAGFFDGWAEICKISAIASLATWKVKEDILSMLPT